MKLSSFSYSNKEFQRTSYFDYLSISFRIPGSFRSLDQQQFQKLYFDIILEVEQKIIQFVCYSSLLQIKNMIIPRRWWKINIAIVTKGTFVILNQWIQKFTGEIFLFERKFIKFWEFQTRSYHFGKVSPMVKLGNEIFSIIEIFKIFKIEEFNWKLGC